jgi:DedD protein
MAEAQDVDSLKRRGRRRLVGAVALVLLAVIVLPMVFDPEPRRSGPPVSVRIPGEDDSPFAPKMAKAPEKKAVDEKKLVDKKSEEKKAEPPAAEKKAEQPPVAANKAEAPPAAEKQPAATAEKPAAPAAEKQAASAAEKQPTPAVAEKKAEGKGAEAERARAQAALASGGYVIPVGAFANAELVTARLAEAKVPYYTEAVPTAKGTVTRVRAGPFASKDAADKAMEKLKGLGFKPGNVASRS